MGVDKEGRPRKGKPAYFDLLKFFQREHDFVSVVNSPDLYTWNGSHWNRRFKDEITGFAQDHFDPKPDDKMRQEFYKHVKHESRVQNDWFEGRTRGLFNFSNGVYDVAEGVLKPHFKESGFKFTLPCEFTPSAEAPQFRQFMRNITLDRLELELVLQEFMGYILSGMEPIHAKALALLGTGSNGKSTFINVLRDLIGKDGYSSLSLKDMQNDQARYLLANKIVNFAEENSRDSFKDTELVKNFVSGGEIRAKQLYAQPFEFKNNSKLIINMNELPTNYDRTHGFFRRLLIVPFDARFDGKADDKKMNKKLREEMSGIFNYAIEGYKRLVQQDGFTDSRIVAEALENYSIESSEVKSWLLDEVSYEPQARLTMQKQQIYNSYREYCEKTGTKWPLSMNEFFKQMRLAMESLQMKYEEVRTTKDGVRLREVSHVRLRAGGMHLVVNFAPGQTTAEVKET
jgi:putative DNA primase/helicase